MNKIYFVSNLKAFAVMMVVFYHCLCPFTPIWSCMDETCIDGLTVCAKFLNSLAMPLFFFLAGYLFFYGKLKGKYSKISFLLRNKFFRLILPFLFWGLVVWLILSNKSIIDFFVYGASHLWFLGTLFFLFVIFSSSYLLKTSFKFDFLLILGLTLISCASLIIPSNPGFIVYQILNYGYIFFAGIFLAKHDIVLKHSLVLLVISIMALLLSNYFFSISIMKIPVKILSLLTVVFLFYASRIYLNKKNPICENIEREGMGIYILHHFFLQFLLTNVVFSGLYYDYHIVSVIISAITLLFICFFCSVLFRKTPLSVFLG